MKKSEELEDLIFSFKSLPGISQKLAEKIAVFLINQDDAYIENFIDVLKQAKNQVHFCSKCNNICNNEICDICENTERDSSKLCIVSTSEDLDKIEETNKLLSGLVNKEYLKDYSAVAKGFRGLRANGSANLIQLNGMDTTTTAIHECMHSLEDANPKMLANSKAFLEYRKKLNITR